MNIPIPATAGLGTLVVLLLLLLFLFLFLLLNIWMASCNRKSRGPALPVGQLTAEEEATASESMKVYLKPVTYYNILEERANDRVNYLFYMLLHLLTEWLIINWIYGS